MTGEIIDIKAAALRPSPETILAAQGVLPDRPVQPKVIELAEKACRLYETLAEPIGLIMNITSVEFTEVYDGLGRNDSPAPLEAIVPRAEALALFAVTSGPAVSKKIDELFKTDDFALGSLLDTAASEGTDRASRIMEDHYTGTFGRNDNPAIVLAYSPGYCGWHVSAQKALFDRLKPERIGITLRESFLMEPLKSISGVLIAGPKDIHLFDNSYSFCGQCQSQPCLPRMRAIGGFD